MSIDVLSRLRWHLLLTSETTFGSAMLVLSIDWENMEGFLISMSIIVQVLIMILLTANSSISRVKVFQIWQRRRSSRVVKMAPGHNMVNNGDLRLVTWVNNFFVWFIIL